MNDAPRRTLRELVGRHGPGLSSDARRCGGLLRDLCGEHRREINILLGALRERVPLDLLAGRNSVPTGLLLTRLAKRLEEHLALTEEAARWAVDSWALALGVVSDVGLEEIKRRGAEAAPRRVEATPTAVTRPAAEEVSKADGPAASSATRPPAPPAPPPTRPVPAATRTPSLSNPAGAQAPATRAPRTATRPQSSPRTANVGAPQSPSADATPRGGRGRRRGCLLGCLLLLLLSVLLAAGAPFVINLLREEQRQRNLEPPPVQTP